MELSIVKAVASFLVPPTGLILMSLVGIGMSLIWRKLGIWVAFISMASLLLCSLPVVSASLINTLQTYPPIPADDLKQKIDEADAVVLLAGGRRKLAEEFGDDTVSSLSLERTRYAAWIVKRTGLPLIISGGRLHNEARSESDLMREILQKELIIIVDYTEQHSRTTYENAKYTAKFLKQNDIKKIALVTHAWHMPRAIAAFKHFDIQVVPAPTAFYGRHLTMDLADYLPSARALMFTGLAFHEIVGQWWYEMRYY